MTDAPPPSPQDGRTSARFGSGATPDLYMRITAQIVEMLERGVVPWRSPIMGAGSAGRPINLNTGRPYHGVNTFLLAVTAWERGYASAYWLTYQQARQRGGSVKRGEKSSTVVFYKPLETTDTKTGEVKRAFVLRHFNVFNVEQCEDIQAPETTVGPAEAFKPIESAKTIVEGYQCGPVIEHTGHQAVYLPVVDLVRLPEPERFVSSEAYFATLFHELAHSTGHSSRLDRGIDRDLRPFGSPDYKKEELVAEMAAAFLCARSRIEPAVIENQAAYISGWLEALKRDKRLVVHCGGAAQRAADWIVNERPSESHEPSQMAEEPSCEPPDATDPSDLDVA